MTIRALALAALATIALSAPISTAAFAQNSSSVISSGNGGSVSVNQRGNRGNDAQTIVTGNRNSVKHTQTGRTNTSGVDAQGDRNRVTVDQRARRR